MMRLNLIAVLFIVGCHAQTETPKPVPGRCLLRADSGPCEALIPSYYYDSSTGRCEKFNYGGCQGNDNRFSTLADCENTCSQDICSLPAEIGPCKAYLPRFYFNKQTGSCERFGYGGCSGNANRFNTTADCQKACVPVIPVTTQVTRDPCRNKNCGNGYCSAPADLPYCICDKGYYGDECQFSESNVLTQCETVKCSRGTVCRGVHTSTFTEPQIKCVNVSLLQGVDDVCVKNNYQAAVLEEEPGRISSYNIKKCSVGMMVGQLCPVGSACVEDNNVGTCCMGKSQIKPGSCPVIEPGSFGICGETFCESDFNCKGDDKCCASACGGQLCTAVDLGCGRCEPGFVCVQRPVDCPPGRLCIQSLVPTCVPEACKDCRADQECRNVTNTQACRRGEKCPEFRFFCGLKSNNNCGPEFPCPEGQTCLSATRCMSQLRASNTSRSDNEDPSCATDTFCIADAVTAAPTSPPTNENVRDLCKNVLCKRDQVCRIVSACDTCVPVGHCVNNSLFTSQPDLDSVCTSQRYLNSLLVKTIVSDIYRTKRCSTSFQQETCPNGSVCVSEDSSIGTCCTGKPNTKPNTKPGTCPVFSSDSIGICGGTFCESDSDCKGDDKCCASACGGQLCTAVDLGCGRCEPGFQCVQKPVECLPGRMCIQALVPTCVPEACVDCDSSQECRNVTNNQPCKPGEICSRFRYFCALKSDIKCGPHLPCDEGEICQSFLMCESRPVTKTPVRLRRQAIAENFEDVYDPYCARVTMCEPNPNKPGYCPVSQIGVCGGTFCSEDSQCPGTQKCCDSACGGKLCTIPVDSIGTTTTRPTDYCGGCPKGQKCVDTGIRCVTTPCPTWQCQPDCADQCNQNQVCQLLNTPCAPGSLSCDPVPVCVDKPCSKSCNKGQNCEVRKSCNYWGFCRSVEKCLPSRPAPCPGDCSKGQVCQWDVRNCWGILCLFRKSQFEPKCINIPEARPKGDCPVATSSGCVWRKYFLSNECRRDSDCTNNQRCCKADCGFTKCINFN